MCSSQGQGVAKISVQMDLGRHKRLMLLSYTGSRAYPVQGEGDAVSVESEGRPAFMISGAQPQGTSALG